MVILLLAVVSCVCAGPLVPKAANTAPGSGQNLGYVRCPDGSPPMTGPQGLLPCTPGYGCPATHDCVNGGGAAGMCCPKRTYGGLGAQSMPVTGSPSAPVQGQPCPPPPPPPEEAAKAGCRFEPRGGSAGCPSGYDLVCESGNATGHGPESPTQSPPAGMGGSASGAPAAAPGPFPTPAGGRENEPTPPPIESPEGATPSLPVGFPEMGPNMSLPSGPEVNAPPSNVGNETVGDYDYTVQENATEPQLGAGEAGNITSGALFPSLPVDTGLGEGNESILAGPSGPGPEEGAAPNDGNQTGYYSATSTPGPMGEPALNETNTTPQASIAESEMPIGPSGSSGATSMPVESSSLSGVVEPFDASAGEPMPGNGTVPDIFSTNISAPPPPELPGAPPTNETAQPQEGVFTGPIVEPGPGQSLPPSAISPINGTSMNETGPVSGCPPDSPMCPLPPTAPEANGTIPPLVPESDMSHPQTNETESPMMPEMPVEAPTASSSSPLDMGLIGDNTTAEGQVPLSTFSPGLIEGSGPGSGSAAPEIAATNETETEMSGPLTEPFGAGESPMGANASLSPSMPFETAAGAAEIPEDVSNTSVETGQYNATDIPIGFGGAYSTTEGIAMPIAGGVESVNSNESTPTGLHEMEPESAFNTSELPAGPMLTTLESSTGAPLGESENASLNNASPPDASLELPEELLPENETAPPTLSEGSVSSKPTAAAGKYEISASTGRPVAARSRSRPGGAVQNASESVDSSSQSVSGIDEESWDSMFGIESPMKQIPDAVTFRRSSGPAVPTSGQFVPCQRNADCYSLREPDEWCQRDQPSYTWTDKSCFCAADTEVQSCIIERFDMASGKIQWTFCTPDAQFDCNKGARRRTRVRN